MKITYSYAFKTKVKNAYPDDERLAELLDMDSYEVGQVLLDHANALPNSSLGTHSGYVQFAESRKGKLELYKEWVEISEK